MFKISIHVSLHFSSHQRLDAALRRAAAAESRAADLHTQALAHEVRATAAATEAVRAQTALAELRASADAQAQRFRDDIARLTRDTQASKDGALCAFNLRSQFSQQCQRILHHESTEFSSELFTFILCYCPSSVLDAARAALESDEARTKRAATERALEVALAKNECERWRQRALGAWSVLCGNAFANSPLIRQSMTSHHPHQLPPLPVQRPRRRATPSKRNDAQSLSCTT